MKNQTKIDKKTMIVINNNSKNNKHGDYYDTDKNQ